MPRLSAFTPLGHLRLAGARSDGETFYTSLREGQGGNAVLARDGWQDARLYAEAMTLARAKRCTESAFEQSLPSHVTELLEEREREYGLPVSLALSDNARRARLTDLYRLPVAPTLANLTAKMTEIWGADLVGVTAPTLAAQGSNGETWGDLATPKLVRVAETATAGSPATIVVTVAMGPAPEPGDKFTFAASPAAVFAGAVSAVVANPEGTYTLTVASLSNPLPAGALGRTGTYSGARISKGIVRVQINAVALLDGTRRGRTESYLLRTLRGSHTWELVPSDVAVFTVGSGRVGVDRIGAL